MARVYRYEKVPRFYRLPRKYQQKHLQLTKAAGVPCHCNVPEIIIAFPDILFCLLLEFLMHP